MKRLVIVSNRLPVSAERKRGQIKFQPSAGGLATGLGSFYSSYESMWVGWPGVAVQKRNLEECDRIRDALLTDHRCFPVFLSDREIEDYYEGFCNSTIWPLCHYFTQYVVYDARLYSSYKRVNERFCEALLDVVDEDDVIWVHDYHLMLLPQMLRDHLPNSTIGFFHHIPFPSYETFRAMPWRKEVLQGLLGADLIGFHTFDYARHFHSGVRNLLGYESSGEHIMTGDRAIRVDVFPMGIDYDRFASAAQNSETRGTMEKLKKRCGECKVVLSVDRLDYSKGIPQRLEAFNEFLRRNPELKEKVILIVVAVPSRTKVDHYQSLKKEVDELVGRINGEHGSLGWVPVWYLYRFLKFPMLNALYALADIAMVTPARDGMNLIAKEYVASRSDGRGVLILSEMAGASSELGEALIVNPNNREEMVEALERAFLMSEDEQHSRMSNMQQRLQRYHVRRWAEDFLERLAHIKDVQGEMNARNVTQSIRDRMVHDYRQSRHRLLVLDYDGTLTPLFLRPEEAEPTPQLLRVLSALADDPHNQIVIISGRDKDTLERWFGNLPVRLVAEHGAWIKEQRWEVIEPMYTDWKAEIYPVMEVYVDRTPGSFVEEKEFSLVWHFRKAEKQLAAERARELRETLMALTANLNIGVLEGSKVIEVKNRGINKGRAASQWIFRDPWDFILAAGDDVTDEDIFAVTPDYAYSIKVGPGPTKARFTMTSHDDVVDLLEVLGSQESPAVQGAER